MEELPTYKITIDEQYNDGQEPLGIDMIAFTSNPAVLVKGVAFKSQNKLSFSDNLKYRITAPAMIPMEIYRRDEEMGEYYVQFTEEEIDTIHKEFMSDLKNRDIFNLEHNAEQKVPAYLLEAWIVDNPKEDKSYATFGIDVPKGTLMVTAQITDEGYYQELVKEGRVGLCHADPRARGGCDARSRAAGPRARRRRRPRRCEGAGAEAGRAIAEVDGLRGFTQQMVDQVYSFGELGFQEIETSRYLTGVLRKHGFAVTEGVAGIPTAWFASWGSGKPVIALGSDIDGLPQTNQKPGIPWHEPLVEGAPGHGEGHNSGVPLNITAALAVKRIMEREKLGGTISVAGAGGHYGTTTDMRVTHRYLTIHYEASGYNVSGAHGRKSLGVYRLEQGKRCNR